MEILLHRKILNENSTEGNMYIQQSDGSWKWFCHCIEDKVRAKAGLWNKLFKVYAKTAIPYGRYPVMATWSNRFQRILTGVFNVPNFEGIRIHNGVNEISSAGCPIISYKNDAPNKRLINDKAAMNDLCKMVEEKQKTEKVWINIVDKMP